MPIPRFAELMDYGKFKYREQKKAHEAKLKQKQIQVKEVKFRPGTDEGDYQIKLRNLIRFLEEGDKTKVTLRFRGREMAHQEFGVRLLERVRDDLEPYGVVEQLPEDGRPADDHGARAEEGQEERGQQEGRRRTNEKDERRLAAGARQGRDAEQPRIRLAKRLASSAGTEQAVPRTKRSARSHPAAIGERLPCRR